MGKPSINSKKSPKRHIELMMKFRHPAMKEINHSKYQLECLSIEKKRLVVVDVLWRYNSW